MSISKQNLQDQYYHMVNHTNIVSKTDLKGNIIYANDKFCKISGYTREELEGHSHNIVRHPDMDKKVFRQMWETIRAGKIWEGRVKNKKKDEKNENIQNFFLLKTNLLYVYLKCV